MDLKAGGRFRSATSEAEVIIVRPPTRAVVLACGGVPMTAVGTQATLQATPVGGLEQPIVLGKRYTDDSSNLEVLCTKAGDGSLSVGGTPLALKAPKQLPSSD